MPHWRCYSSGQFTILAWVSARVAYGKGPAVDDPQGMDLIDVTCKSDGGCYPARDARITIR